MKKIEDYLEKETIKKIDMVLIKKFEDMLSAMDPDDAERILSVYLSNHMERDYKERGTTYTQAINNKNKILFTDSGQYKWNAGDHSGYMISESGEAVEYTMEPYYIWKEDLSDLLEWSKKEGFNFYIDGKSPHFPGRTVMIHIIKNLSLDN